MAPTASIHRAVHTASLRNKRSGMPAMTSLMSAGSPNSRMSARALSNHQVRKYCFRRRFCVHRMMHNRRWFVPQLLPRGEQPATELGILVTNFAAGSGAQVRPKTSILSKHSLLESHVRTERGLCQPCGLKAKVEGSEWCQGVAPLLSGSHRGGAEQFHSGRMRPPQPAHLPLSKGAVRFCNHIGSTLTSSSMNASTSPWASAIPLLRACDFPGCGSNR